MPEKVQVDSAIHVVPSLRTSFLLQSFFKCASLPQSALRSSYSMHESSLMEFLGGSLRLDRAQCMYFVFMFGSFFLRAGVP